MEISEIIGWSGGGLVLLLSLIQIAPLKLNPLSWLARKIGKAINGEVLEKVKELDLKIDAVDKKTELLSEKEDMKTAVQCRARILRFGDEILHGVQHSKEHFDSVLLDITDYQQYCRTHEDFANHVTLHTTTKIEAVYQHLLDTGGFL